MPGPGDDSLASMGPAALLHRWQVERLNLAIQVRPVPSRRTHSQICLPEMAVPDAKRDTHGAFNRKARVEGAERLSPDAMR